METPRFVDLQAVVGLLMLGCFVGAGAEPMALASAGKRPGIAPLSTGHCPSSHPIKGNFTTYSGERCIYHLPGQHFYGKTRAERCYATEAEALKDGCRRAKV